MAADITDTETVKCSQPGKTVYDIYTEKQLWKPTHYTSKMGCTQFQLFGLSTSY